MGINAPFRDPPPPPPVVAKGCVHCVEIGTLTVEVNAPFRDNGGGGGVPCLERVC